MASVREHPDWCASEHARAIGVSRERVRQLRDQLGLSLPDKRRRGPRDPVICAGCGKPTDGRSLRHRACRSSRYGVPARSKEYQRRWQRDYARRRTLLDDDAEEALR